MSNGKKHLIVIHGRSVKPSEKEKKQLVRKALLNGLARADRTTADRLKSGNVKFTFVYYGDISNERILKKDPSKGSRLTGKDPQHGNGPCEPDGLYDDGLARLAQQKNFSQAAYKKFLDQHPDQSWRDDAASVIGFLGGLTGFSDNVIKIATADMGAYLMTREFGSAIRERLQTPLKKALKANDDICLVAHSMGCIVSYDVMWKFSRMSEYRDVQETGNRVNLWLTLGNPLGEKGVIDNLYDADEREDGVYPRHIIRDWVNVSARDDFISHDDRIANDYKQMQKWGYLESIRDITKIHNFWLGPRRTNPHKFYGYLDHPVVGKQIAGWMAE